MILKGNRKKTFSISLPWILGMALVGLIAYTLVQWVRTQPKYETVTAYCDAEHIEGDQFVTDKHKFNNATTQSDEESYSGSHSSVVNPSRKYGMSYLLTDPPSHVKVKASIRRLSNNQTTSALAINTEPAGKAHTQSSTVVSKDENGWELIEAELILPDTVNLTKLLVFPYLISGNDNVYFDDLTVEIVDLPTAEELDLDRLHLYLDDKALNIINTKRHEALKKGLLQTGDNDWAKAKLTANDSIEHNVKVRLKGDWTDHLKGSYWSYRVKMPSDKSWNRLQTFSLQNPNTRSYLDEWIYHKALEKVDVITPRYGFVEFRQNNQQLILYAYEEHFEKQIAEYRNRREGVIIKLSDEYLWNQRIINRGAPQEEIFENAVSNSDILPFGEKKTLANPKLKEQFLNAQDLIHAFKHREIDVEDIFDLEKLAKYFVITDIFNANHGVIWHNMRWYYNAITRKLEPIGFDGFTENGPFRMYARLFFGEFKSSEDEIEWSAFYKHIFRNEEFNKHYVPLLKKYTDSKFTNDLLNEHSSEINRLESLIRIYNKSDYKFDINRIKNRAASIHKNIIPVSEQSIKAYRANTSDNTIEISNYHPIPITIIGSGTSKEMDTESTLSTMINSNGRHRPVSFTTVEIPSSHTYIYYQLYGTDQIYHSRIKAWKNPTTPVIRYSDQNNMNIPLPKGRYDIVEDKVVIYGGNYSLDRPMVLPKGKSLVIEQGTKIDLTKKAYILVRGDVQLRGSEANPIQITSSDKSSQGFIVLDAPRRSNLQYASFSDLNTLEENEWQLTGAVTFYQSDVDMINVTIRDNNCEDALNIIRSDFDITKLNINNTFADGFDSDFCKGRIVNSYFENTGNDAVDYSGSVVTLENLTLINIGDKGISAGEEATLKLKNIDIDGAVIGVASKDLSLVQVENLNMNNCSQGFAAYRKKPEFGGGRIEVKSYTANNVDKIIQKDSESKITLPE